jgi:hypothetical protein
MSDPTDIGCVALSIRDHKERLVLDTSDGRVIVEIRPQSAVRAKVIVRAPKAVRIGREKREVPSDAV